jgi:hypothetical protein
MRAGAAGGGTVEVAAQDDRLVVVGFEGLEVLLEAAVPDLDAKVEPLELVAAVGHVHPHHEKRRVLKRDRPPLQRGLFLRTAPCKTAQPSAPLITGRASARGRRTASGPSASVMVGRPYVTPSGAGPLSPPPPPPGAPALAGLAKKWSMVACSIEASPLSALGAGNGLCVAGPRSGTRHATHRSQQQID